MSPQTRLSLDSRLRGNDERPGDSLIFGPILSPDHHDAGGTAPVCEQIRP